MVAQAPPGCAPPATGDQLNQTNLTDVNFCSTDVPTSKQLFAVLPIGGIVLMSLLALFTLTTVSIYIEEIVFILKYFRKGTRKQKTIWILAFFPVYSISGLLGCFVPRSGSLVDMVAAVYFSTCLYNFGRLMVCYMGGPHRMWALIEDKRVVHLNTPPCCCCCVCLPTPTFKRRLYFKITMLIMQCAIVRPILMFLAAVMWTNGSYQPGDMSPHNGFLYVTVINLLSSLSAMYGLMVLRGILRPELEEMFAISGKIAALQLTLLCSALPNLIIGALVTTDVIKCSPMFPSKARGEAIYHSFLVLMMLPFSLLGRYFYRRKSDGVLFAQAAPGRKVPKPINEIGTDDEEVIDQPAAAAELVQLRDNYINAGPALTTGFVRSSGSARTSGSARASGSSRKSGSSRNSGPAPKSGSARRSKKPKVVLNNNTDEMLNGDEPVTDDEEREVGDSELDTDDAFGANNDEIVRTASGNELTETQLEMMIKKSGYCEVSV